MHLLSIRALHCRSDQNLGRLNRLFCGLLSMPLTLGSVRQFFAPQTEVAQQCRIRTAELFSGTGSIGHYLVKQPGDFEPSFSLDIDANNNPSIVSDILKWDYKAFKPGHFDICWASPPCTEFSIAKTVGKRDLTLANRIVRRTLKIIAYLEPKVYFIENPQTGLLKDQSFMKNLHFYDCDYCQYGFPYRKRTRIWTNLRNFNAKLCPGPGNCPFIMGKSHEAVVSKPKRVSQDNIYCVTSLKLKHRIPPKLVAALFSAARKHISGK